MERDLTTWWWRQALKYHSRLKQPRRHSDAAYAASMVDEDTLPDDFYRNNNLHEQPWLEEYLRLQYEL